MMKILITGHIGFIGSALYTRLHNSHDVYGLDEFTNITDIHRLREIFDLNKFDLVIHLAAKSSVFESFDHPNWYYDVNVTGFNNIIYQCKLHNIKLIYASSSAVYGNTLELPLNDSDTNIKPVSVYGQTKLMNEMVAEMYSNLYNMTCTGLRLFNVYGPNMRPDLAIAKFANNFIHNKLITLYNNGNVSKDYIHIDDVTYIIEQLVNNQPDGHSIINIGTGESQNISEIISIMEDYFRKPANLNYAPLPSGDIPKSRACIKKLKSLIDFKPIEFEEGLTQYLEWCQNQ